MDMPDITLVQKLVGAVLAAVSAVLAVLTAFDVVTVTQAGAVGGAIGAIGSVYLAADAVIRNGRSRALAQPDKVHALERMGPPSGSPYGE